MNVHGSFKLSAKSITDRWQSLSSWFETKELATSPLVWCVECKTATKWPVMHRCAEKAYPDHMNSFRWPRSRATIDSLTFQERQEEDKRATCSWISSLMFQPCPIHPSLNHLCIRHYRIHDSHKWLSFCVALDCVFCFNCGSCWWVSSLKKTKYLRFPVQWSEHSWWSWFHICSSLWKWQSTVVAGGEKPL